MSYRIAMIGAGSIGFSRAIAEGLICKERFKGSTFVMMDIDENRLEASAAGIRERVAASGFPLGITTTTNRRAALDGADFIVTSFAPSRLQFWQQDVDIAERYGVFQIIGENGGPPGVVHALRNVTIMKEIAQDVEEYCPQAWLMNFTNPMSVLCTYLYNHTAVKAQGFCHQVHGSFGVVAEMLGLAPGDLEVITAGINHMNFLLDIRRRGSGESCMEAFVQAIRQNPHWHQNEDNIPEQTFSLEFYEAFGVYPVGYDNHICEYMPFFYGKEEALRRGYQHISVLLQRSVVQQATTAVINKTVTQAEPECAAVEGIYPFPKDPNHPYYRESPVSVMEALISNTPLYLDAAVVRNDGCVTNLPAEAAVDIPAVVIGGRVRGVSVGALPVFPAELCRRQSVVHELIVQAALTGDRRLMLEALCLVPGARDLQTNRQLMNDYLTEYREYLPQFFA